MTNYLSYSDINGSLTDPFSTTKWVEGSIWDAFYHRQQALICRGLAASCFHYPTRDALLELAAEHDAKADRLEGSKANCSNEDADR